MLYSGQPRTWGEELINDATSRPAVADRILSPSFVFLITGAFGFYGSMWLIAALLPAYVLSLKGSEADIGLTLGAFAVTALLARPLVGRLVDTIGRKTVALIGCVIYTIAPLLYIGSTSVPLLVLTRMFHGLGISFFSTASTTWVADMVPPARRAQAMGLFSNASQAAIALAPMLGAIVYGQSGFPLLFVAAALGGGVAALLVSAAHEEKRALHLVGANVGFRAALGRPEVLALAFALMTTAATWGILVSFLPVVAAQRNAGQSAWFFTIYAVCTIGLRLMIGPLADRLGRKMVAVPCLVLLAVVMVLFSTLSSPLTLYTLAVLYALSFGTMFPTLSAFLVDVVPATVRGSAVGVFTAGFDLGIAVGSYGGGLLAEALGIGATFVASGMLCLVGVAVLAMGTREPGQNDTSNDTSGAS